MNMIWTSRTSGHRGHPKSGNYSKIKRKGEGFDFTYNTFRILDVLDVPMSLC